MFTACFIVNEAGTELTANGIDCQSFAIQVMVEDCGSLWVRNPIQIVNGSFEISEFDSIIRGTFDSDSMASGTFEETAKGCSGPWTATPAMR